MKSLFFGFLFTITSVVVVVSTGTSTENPSLEPAMFDKTWQNFKAQFAKSYASAAEENSRKQIFQTNYQQILSQNALAAKKQSSYTAAINQFSDMQLSEYTAMLNGFTPIKGGQPSVGDTGTVTPSTSTTSNTAAPTSATSTTTAIPMINGYPASVDWRTQGYVTPVKNQGSCADCWAFSSTGSLEGQHFRKTGTLVSLSEQNLLDCAEGPTYANTGCSGGNMYYAFQYVKANKGIDTEASYPYVAKEGSSCLYNSTNLGATIKSFTVLPENNETALMQAVATIGPISVCLNDGYTSFQTYSSGIYNNPNCTNAVNHAALVVGYGTQNGTDYWIVKNSWGTTWGNAGYILMSRNNGNQCGIASYSVYPTV